MGGQAWLQVISPQRYKMTIEMRIAPAHEIVSNPLCFERYRHSIGVYLRVKSYTGTSKIPMLHSPGESGHIVVLKIILQAMKYVLIAIRPYLWLMLDECIVPGLSVSQLWVDLQYCISVPESCCTTQRTPSHDRREEKGGEGMGRGTYGVNIPKLLDVSGYASCDYSCSITGNIIDMILSKGM